MHDGTTPLMLAVRLAVEGMVEELINADADVNAIDAQGMQAYQFQDSLLVSRAVPNILFVFYLG